MGGTAVHDSYQAGLADEEVQEEGREEEAHGCPFEKQINVLSRTSELQPFSAP